MFLKSIQRIKPIFQITDASVIIACWLAAYWFRFEGGFAINKGVADFTSYLAAAPPAVVVWVAVFSFFRVYQSGFNFLGVEHVFLLAKAHLVSLLLFIAMCYFFYEIKTSRGVMLLFGSLSFICLWGWRVISRRILRQWVQRHPTDFHKKVLLLGDPQRLAPFVKLANQAFVPSVRWVGLVFFPAEAASASALDHQLEQAGLPRMPIVDISDDASESGIGAMGLQRLHELVSTLGPDQVVITTHFETQVRNSNISFQSLLKIFQQYPVEITLLPDFEDLLVLGCKLEMHGGCLMLHVNDSELVGWSAVLKRTLDIGVSLFALIFLGPLLLLIAFLIKLTTPGPVLYSQERIGMDGKPFMMFKFRSMRLDAEAATGAVWAKKTDNRTTKLGKWLRKTSLDELPQFWNVLKGDMSLVGPRPERPVFVNQFRRELPHYMLRHKVKAGITGWAQVNGWRGDTSLSKRVEADLYYIRCWSLALDLKILWLTLWKGFVNKNAY
jgi:Undecaprenyl-phosphate glucose phosphotransferase